MRSFRPTVRAALGALAVVGLAGCADTLIQQPVTVNVAPGQALVAFDAPAFANTQATRVRYVDFWQSEEYARFSGRGADAEIIYAQSDLPTRVVLQYSFLVKDRAQTWKRLQGNTADWGESKMTGTKLSRFFWWQPFRMASATRDCFAFSTDWDIYANDIQTRPRKAMFGYYCAAPGDKLSPDRIDGLVAKIGIVGVTVPKTRAAEAEPLNLKPEVQPRSPEWVALARGAGGDAGNPGFPYMFGRYHQESRGSDMM